MRAWSHIIDVASILNPNIAMHHRGLTCCCYTGTQSNESYILPSCQGTCWDVFD